MFQTQFQQKVQKSFELTKQDIYALYDHIQYLHAEIALLKEQHNTKEESSSTGTYFASKTGKKAHIEGCFFAKNIKKRVTFETKEEAVKQGYQICGCIYRLK
ncbi:TPA: hypothetical protein HA278_08650 [Candidatus Woesearchaeota archaeon]|nr:hypothetical protein [Candidatus Woesearchaeota archaeon]|tara:strand:- start:443 stop:748 length:306 start_codon:yes stop_codon:yes gene_type:complete